MSMMCYCGVTNDMAKVRAYIRIAEKQNGEHVVHASQKPNHEPVKTYAGQHLPTASFALDLDVPDEMFRRAEQVLAEIKIMEDGMDIATEVVQNG